MKPLKILAAVALYPVFYIVGLFNFAMMVAIILTAVFPIIGVPYLIFCLIAAFVYAYNSSIKMING